MAGRLNSFCFIHIEKAGGSTIHNWLKYYIPHYQSLRPWYTWTNEPGNHLTSNELRVLKLFHPGLKAFGSHSTRHYLGYEKLFKDKLHYITFLREPISRYLSHFQHQRDVMKNDWTLSSFLCEPKFNNFMSKRLANNVENGELAYKELENHYSFVGLIEKFNESIILLSSLLEDFGVKPFYEKKNEGAKTTKISFQCLPPDIQKKIIENNSEDLILYKKVLNEFYPNQIKENNLDPEKEMEFYNNLINDFRYNPIRKELIRCYKGYNHFITEPIAHQFR